MTSRFLKLLLRSYWTTKVLALILMQACTTPVDFVATDKLQLWLVFQEHEYW